MTNLNPIVKNIALKLCETAPACVLEVLFETLIKVWNDYVREFRLPYRSIDVADLKGMMTDKNAVERSKTVVSKVLQKFDLDLNEIPEEEVSTPQDDEQLFFNYFCKHVDDKNIQPLNGNDNQGISVKRSCSESEDTKNFCINVEENNANADLQRKSKNTEKYNETTEMYKIKLDDNIRDVENEVTHKQKDIVMQMPLQMKIDTSDKLAKSFVDEKKSNNEMDQYTQNVESNRINLQEASADKENASDFETLYTLQNSFESNLAKGAKLIEPHIQSTQKTFPSPTVSFNLHNEISTDCGKLMVSYDEEKWQSKCNSLMKLNMEKIEEQYTSQNRLEFRTESLQRCNESSNLSHFATSLPSYGLNSNFLKSNENSFFDLHSDINDTLENNKVTQKLECEVDKWFQRENLPVSTIFAKNSIPKNSDHKEENREIIHFSAKSEIYNEDRSEKLKKNAMIDSIFNLQHCNNEFPTGKCVNTTMDEKSSEQKKVTMKVSNSKENEVEHKSRLTAKNQTKRDRIKSKSTKEQKYMLWNPNYLELVGKEGNSSFKQEETAKQIKSESESRIKENKYGSEDNIINDFNRQHTTQQCEDKNCHKINYSNENKINISRYDKHKSLNRRNEDVFLSNIRVNSEVNSNIVVSSRQGGDMPVRESDCELRPVTEVNVEKYMQYVKSMKAKEQYIETFHQNSTVVVFGSCPMCTEKNSMFTPSKNRKLDMYPKRVFERKKRCRKSRQSTRNDLCTTSSQREDGRRVSFSEDICVFSFDPEKSILETFYDCIANVERNVEKKRETQKCSSVIQFVEGNPGAVENSSNEIQAADSVDFSLEGDQKQEEKDNDKHSPTNLEGEENTEKTVNSYSSQGQCGEPAEYINTGFVDVPLFDCFPDFEQDSCDGTSDLQQTDDESLLSKECTFRAGDPDTLPKVLKNAEANIKRWALKNLMHRKRLSFQKMKDAIRKK